MQGLPLQVRLTCTSVTGTGAAIFLDESRRHDNARSILGKIGVVLGPHVGPHVRTSTPQSCRVLACKILCMQDNRHDERPRRPRPGKKSLIEAYETETYNLKRQRRRFGRRAAAEVRRGAQTTRATGRASSRSRPRPRQSPSKELRWRRRRRADHRGAKAVPAKAGVARTRGL